MQTVAPSDETILRWNVLEDLLSKSLMLLPEVDADAQEFLDNNEFELAWNSLFEAGKRTPPISFRLEFWCYLWTAAYVMERPMKAMEAFKASGGTEEELRGTP